MAEQAQCDVDWRVKRAQALPPLVSIQWEEKWQSTSWKAGGRIGEKLDHFVVVFESRIVEPQKFPFSEFPTKDAARIAADAWRVAKSDEHDMTKNRFRLSIDGKWLQVQLTKGKRAVVDSSRKQIVEKHIWHATQQGYAAAMPMIYMHDLISGATEEESTDHILRNKSDNRDYNLRAVTRTTNNRNKNRQRNNTSGVTNIHEYRNTKGGPFKGFRVRLPHPTIKGKRSSQKFSFAKYGTRKKTFAAAKVYCQDQRTKLGYVTLDGDVADDVNDSDNTNDQGEDVEVEDDDSPSEVEEDVQGITDDNELEKEVMTKKPRLDDCFETMEQVTLDLFP